ncbi:MAG: ketoacyl-ACP synthase III [Ruminococcus sp.]|nr:ketoacyl-ACP synthase III [Ruminococcus sp.]
MGIRILGTGSYTPDFQVTNDDMAKIVETNDEWIRTRTGISTRHISDGEPTWYMGAQAAKRAIEAANIDSADIGLIIDTTITNDYITPSMSCIIQREVKAVNAACFDLNAACSGFVYGMDTAHRFLMTDRKMKYALVVANESLSKITNYSDRSSCILFGDGAAAAVIEYDENALYTSHLGADGTGAKYLYARTAVPESPFSKAENREKYKDEVGAGPEGWEHTMIQDGKEVYRFATHALAKAANLAAEKIGFDLNDLDKVVPHQANMRIIETAMKYLKQPMEKAVVNIANHGNTSSASIPIALDEAVRSGEIKRGDKICLVGFGAGLTYAAMILEY